MRAPAQVLQELFAPGSSEHACLFARDPHDKATYYTRGEPLSVGMLEAHLAGDCRVGAIPKLGLARCQWACLDLDVNSSLGLLSDARARETMARLVERLADAGLLLYLERSKSRGYHGWLFFDAPVEIPRLRGLLAPLLDATLPGWSALADAICPRGIGHSVGNGVWLPLCGADRGGRTRWLDAATFDPFTDQIARTGWIHAHGRSPAKVVEGFCGEMNPGQISQLRRVGSPASMLRVLECLDDRGLLENLTVWKTYGEKIRLRCPFHPERAGHSVDHAVLFANGNFSCLSCGKRTRGLREFILALRIGGRARG